MARPRIPGQRSSAAYPHDPYPPDEFPHDQYPPDEFPHDRFARDRFTHDELPPERPPRLAARARSWRADRGGSRSASRPSAPIQDAVMQAVDLVKVHGHGSRAVLALDGVTMAIERGRFTTIMGPSGSGKSTLLHCLAGLDTVTSGHVLLGRTDISRLSERKLTRLRRGKIGFVFQAYDLLPQLTVQQNIVLPVEVAGARVDRAWLGTVLEALDLGAVLRQLPGQLSGGQQQRVAVARAVLPRPDVVLADEPTGALDAGTTREMLGFLRASVDHLGQTVVMVTHDPLAAQHTDRALMLHEGRLAGEMIDPTAHGVLDALAALDVAAPGPGERDDDQHRSGRDDDRDHAQSDDGRRGPARDAVGHRTRAASGNGNGHRGNGYGYAPTDGGNRGSRASGIGRNGHLPDDGHRNGGSTWSNGGGAAGHGGHPGRDDGLRTGRGNGRGDGRGGNGHRGDVLPGDVAYEPAWPDDGRPDLGRPGGRPDDRPDRAAARRSAPPRASHHRAARRG